MAPDTTPRSSANADVLLWQSRVRAAVVIIVGLAEYALMRLGAMAGSTRLLVLVIAGYVFATALLALVAHRRRSAPNWLIAATVLADLVFVFGVTIAASPPQYYDRILVFSFFVLHLTESHYGRTHATIALAASVIGYVTLISYALSEGAELSQTQELWSVLVFATAAGVFILQYGSFRDRLRKLVRLFERLEEGEFTHSYDADADRQPDAVTQVGQAYNRVRRQLGSMVLTDPLTGSLNRRGFDQALAREVSRANRAGSDIALLALDLDHFKDINDTHGHPVGDAVLREAAALLMHAARAGDVVARTGGEEFSILLPDTGRSGAFHLASRLCDLLRERPFRVNGMDVRLTASIGVIAQPVGTDSRGTREVAEELKQRADEALYTAKRSGRDRVWMWKGSEQAPPGVRPSEIIEGILDGTPERAG